MNLSHGPTHIQKKPSNLVQGMPKERTVDKLSLVVLLGQDEERHATLLKRRFNF